MSIGARSKRGDLTFEAIVTAAEEQFLTKGFDGTKIDDIAQAAYVSVGTVYLHFQNKDGVYAAVILRAQRILLEQYLDPAFDLEVPPWERIETWCHAFVRFFEEQEPRARIMALQAYGAGTSEAPEAMHKALHDNITRFHGRLVALFEEAGEAGDLGAVDPVAASRFVWSSVYGVCTTNLRHGSLRLDYDGVRDVLRAGLELMRGQRGG